MLQISLQGKTALVTGYSSIFGNEICTALANAGADVWVHTFDQVEQAAEFCQQIKLNGGNAALQIGDITQPKEVHKLVDCILKESGKIDILINNTEVSAFKSLNDVSPEEWIKTFERNVDVPFLCCKEIIPHMVEKGEGYIVNISSAAGVTGEMAPDYAASKSTLNSMTKGLAREFKEQGIRINGIAPAVVTVDDNDTQKAVKKAVANMVLVLSSELGNLINGETIMLDGGESIA
jgi:NAD(P)-dependent dehydrogenase (short-subunit alcohol dehydrogenase family)